MSEKVYESPRDLRTKLKVRGVGRVGDEPRALLVQLNERPTDDELRFLHDVLDRAVACTPNQPQPPLRVIK